MFEVCVKMLIRVLFFQTTTVFIKIILSTFLWTNALFFSWFDFSIKTDTFLNQTLTGHHGAFPSGVSLRVDRNFSQVFCPLECLDGAFKGSNWVTVSALFGFSELTVVKQTKKINMCCSGAFLTVELFQVKSYGRVQRKSLLQPAIRTSWS